HFKLSPKYSRFIQGRQNTITDSSRLHHTVTACQATSRLCFATALQALGMTSVSWCPLRPCEPWLSILSARRVAQNVNESHRNMSAEIKREIQLEIAHLLFIDVVGYSKLLVNEQIELMQQLNRIVRGTECFRDAEASGKLIRLPTGDGMVLLIFRSPEQ